jgi:electron transport complex protein RnfA
MDFGVLVGIFITVVLINNLVFAGFLGICPFLGVSRKIDMAFGMGCAVTFVITMSGIVTWLIMHGILAPLGEALFGNPQALNVLQYVAFIMVIASMVQLVEMYLKKFFPPLYAALGVFLPLITTNCAILGACLYIYLKGEAGGPTNEFIPAVVYALGGGLGFTLAITIMAGIREHLRFSTIPKPFQGAGITLLIAGILAMAFTGFTGIKFGT